VVTEDSNDVNTVKDSNDVNYRSLLTEKVRCAVLTLSEVRSKFCQKILDLYGKIRNCNYLRRYHIPAAGFRQFLVPVMVILSFVCWHFDISCYFKKSITHRKKRMLNYLRIKKEIREISKNKKGDLDSTNSRPYFYDRLIGNMA
jgi:hypothetical protein